MRKCRHKRLALVTGEIELLKPDQEPYKEGVIEEMCEIHPYIAFSGHWCPKCEKLVDIALYE